MMPIRRSMAWKCFSAKTGSIESLWRLFLSAAPSETGLLWNCSNVDNVEDLDNGKDENRSVVVVQVVKRRHSFCAGQV